MVTYIPAVLTPATGIKVRSSSQAVKVETIKRSRSSFAQLKSRVKALLAVRSSDRGPKMAPIKFWSQSQVSAQQIYIILVLCYSIASRCSAKFDAWIRMVHTAHTKAGSAHLKITRYNNIMILYIIICIIAYKSSFQNSILIFKATLHFNFKHHQPLKYNILLASSLILNYVFFWCFN